MSDSTLFIPDITGFTRFVKETEINHSQHIIEELINVIIEKGSQAMEVAEVEGDAVFFFKHGRRLSIEDVMLEAKRIYRAFHRHLLQYEHRRVCNCGACTTAANLKLKFVTHAGEVNLAAFSGARQKPFGGAVIAAHRLLKNDIQHEEYILFSDDFLAESAFIGEGHGHFQDRDLGRLGYQYHVIDGWKKDLDLSEAPDSLARPDLVVEASDDIPFNIDVLQNFIMDFRYRHLWNKGADEIIFDENRINRAGEEHYCIVKGKHLFFDTIKPKVDANQRSYGEILKNPAPLKYFETDFIMTPIDEQRTRLTFRLAISVRWWAQRPLVPLMKPRFLKQAREVLQDIKAALTVHLREESVVA